MPHHDFLIIRRTAVPDVFNRVLEAKRMLAAGKASSVGDAVKKAGISRSSFYKYKDSVFVYTGSREERGIYNITAEIVDKAGMVSAITTVLYRFSVNIVTLNQSVAVEGVTTVALTVDMANAKEDLSLVMDTLRDIDGVRDISLL